MKIFPYLFALLLFSALSHADTLTLADCLRLARERSEQLLLLDQDLQAAEGRYQEAWSQILPQLGLSASERLRNSPSSDVANTPGGNTQGGFVGTRSDRFLNSVTVSQPIFSGFRDYLLMRAAQAEIRASEAQRERAAQLLDQDVAELFFQVLLYKGDLTELGANVQTLEQRIAELQKWLQLGKSRESEVVAAQAELADAHVTEENTRGFYNVSRELLAFLLGLPAEQVQLTAPTPPLLQPDLEPLLAQATSRADLRAANEMRDSAAKQLKAVSRERWPRISLDGNYYLEESPDTSRDWDATFALSMPIFDSGRISSREQQGRAQLRSSELRVEELKRVIERDVRRAYADVVSTLSEYKRLIELVSLSERNFSLQRKDYELGIVTNLQVLQSLRQYRDSRRRLLASQAQLHIKQMRLQVAAGGLS